MTQPSRQSGFTLVEVLMAATVMLAGLGMTLGVFGSSKRAALTAQRIDAASNLAERELDRMRALEWEQLETNGNAVSAGDPAHTCCPYGLMVIRTTPDPYAELLVTPSDSPTALVDPGPEPFEIGGDGDPATSDAGAITGNVYRYLTWRVDGCQGSFCAGGDSKRLIVAVKLDANALGSGPQNVVWLSSIVHDPATGVGQAIERDPGGDGALVAQRLYLHDQSCQFASAQAATSDHPTVNSAAQQGTPGETTGAEQNSRCNNPQQTGDPTARTEADQLLPDPPLTSPAALPYVQPLPKYSDDGDDTADYGGLRMRRAGAHSGDCASAPSDYPWVEGTPDGPNKYNVHRWSTNLLSEDFVLSRRVGITLHTKTLGGEPVRGYICVKLIERFEGDEDACPGPACVVPQETELASFAIDRPIWNSSDQITTFSRRFDLPDTDTDRVPGPLIARAGHRLVLAISMHAGSEDDLVLAYGHPTYPAHLTVETTTPLGS